MSSLYAVAMLAWLSWATPSLADALRWRELGPPILRGKAVFDPASHRLFVLGSQDPRVWVLDLSGGPLQPASWSVLAVNGDSPPGRPGGYAFLDAPRNRLILYGDRENPAAHDLWTLSLSGAPQWTAIPMQGAPPDRYLAGVTFDPVVARLVLFGGQTPGSTSALSYKNDVWVGDLDAGTWQSLSTIGGPPGTRRNTSCAFDSRRRRMIAYGGEGPDASSQIQALTDVWALSLADPPTWSSLTPGNTPSSLGNGKSAAYDSTADQLVLVGSDNAFSLGAVDTTTARSEIWTLPLGIPGPWQLLYSSKIWVDEFSRQAALMAVDSPSRKLLLVGGSRYQNIQSNGWGETRADSWTFDLDSHGYAPVAGAGEIPAPRTGGTLTYDLDTHRFYLFGGRRERTQYLNDLWSISDSMGAQWKKIPNAGPIGRYGHSAIYDPVRHRVVIFGGQGNGTAFADAWAWMPESGFWAPLATSGTPPSARYGHSAVYDAIGDRMVIFGGEDATSDRNDTYALSLSTLTWTQIIGVSPPQMSFHAAVFDPSPGRMVVFSGGAVYALDLVSVPPAWVELIPGSPYGYWRADYDAATDRMFRHAGGIDMFPSAGTVATHLDGDLVSSSLPTLGAIPTRLQHAQAFDPDQRALVAAFGLSGGSSRHLNYLQDTWSLDLGDPSVPILASLVSATADSGAVTVTWLLTGTSSGFVQVERQEDAAAWERRAVLTPDGSGRLTLRDDQVRPGATYGYRLTFGGDVYAGFVEVSVPGAAGASSLALLGAFPNPAAFALSVSFRLPDASPARLDLVDVRGRIAASLDVGSMGPGVHSVRLRPTNGAGSGVYFATLTRGRDRLTTRVVLLGEP